MKLLTQQKKMSTQQGFTLIELLIATAVFSTILLLCTYALLQIGRVYYKGSLNSNTQAVTRTISDEISQSIQFSGGVVGTTPVPPAPIPATVSSLCIGDKSYLYILNKNLGEPAPIGSPNVFVASVNTACPGAGTPFPVTLASGQHELMGVHMRLGKLQVTAVSPGYYSVKVEVIAGAPDLLDTNGNCKSGSGGEFCATSELDTVVRKRL